MDDQPLFLFCLDLSYLATPTAQPNAKMAVNDRAGRLKSRVIIREVIN